MAARLLPLRWGLLGRNGTQKSPVKKEKYWNLNYCYQVPFFLKYPKSFDLQGMLQRPSVWKV